MVERGSLAGSVRKGFSGPKSVTFRGKDGQAIATLTPQATGGEAVEYRVNVVDGSDQSRLCQREQCGPQSLWL